MLLGQPEDFLAVDALLLVQLVVQAGHLRLVLHHLQVVVLPEHALVPGDGGLHGGIVLGQDGAGDLPCYTGRRADEALVVLFNHLVAHPRPVIIAVDAAFRDDLHQVKVALVVLGQEDEVVIALLLDAVVPFGDIDLTADDGLDGGVLLGVLEELLDAVHVAVVRDGKGRHAQFGCTGEKVGYG